MEFDEVTEELRNPPDECPHCGGDLIDRGTFSECDYCGHTDNY